MNPDERDALVAAQRDLAAVRAELHAAIESHKEFAYSVSHDLRAPLRAISGFAAILQEDAGAEQSEDQRRLLDLVCDSARQMNAQLEGLLVLSRIAHRELRHEPVDMTLLAETIVERVRALEPSREVRATVGALAATIGDRDLLHTALYELVKNAWKFTRNQPTATVEIASETDEHQTTYRVRDNGVGFPDAAATRLFVVFRRLHTPKEYEGMGVGLATVKAAVSRHHGRVWADSEPGSGATFSFSLPTP